MGYLYLSLNLVVGAMFTTLAKVSSGISRGKTLGALFFALLVAVVQIAVFWALNGFRVQFDARSFAYAAAYGFTGLFGTIFGLKAYSLGNMATYIVISSAGGILIPYLFGVIFLKEAAGVGQWLGCALVILGIACGWEKKKKEEGEEGKKSSNVLFFLVCLGGAAAGGLSQCVNKMQAIYGGGMDGNSYVIFVQSCLLVYVLIIFACRPRAVAAAFRENPALYGRKNFIVSAVYGVLGGFNTVIALLTNKYLPAVIVFPVMSGLSVVLATMVGRFVFKERLTKGNIAGNALIVAAVVLIMLPV